MKRIICLILTLMLSVSFIGAYADTTTAKLNDLIINEKPHWAYDTIIRAASGNIIVGYPDGTFRPNNNVEVDAYIKMVICALGNSFDNGKDYWASPFIEKAVNLKLINDNEFNTYRRAITREEAAKIIVQALSTIEQLPSEEQIDKYISKIPDYKNIGDEYKKFVLSAYATGMITGDTKGTFSPKYYLSRAEAAVIIMRILDKSLRKPILTDGVILPELLQSDAAVWGREDIYNLTLAGAYIVKDGKIYFNDPPAYENYELDSKLNSDISNQIYRATKTLIDDDHYVYLEYVNSDPKRVLLRYSKSSAYAFNNNSFFNYIFFEKTYNNVRASWNNSNFSEKSYITLNIDRLWWEADISSWSTPYYETKLKHSLMAIFGEIEGKQIYEYIYSMYIDKRNNPSKYVNKCITKKFETIQIDFANDDGSRLNFYFSKVGDN
jgi:hypothetical protein